eukprot:UN32807
MRTGRGTCLGKVVNADSCEPNPCIEHETTQVPAVEIEIITYVIHYSQEIVTNICIATVIVKTATAQVLGILPSSITIIIIDGKDCDENHQANEFLILRWDVQIVNMDIDINT